MDKRRIKAVVFLIVFLLVMAVAVNLLLDMEREKREVVHLPTEAPVTAAPTETPAPTAAPTPIPAETPAPTETPSPTRDPYVDVPETPQPTLQPLPTEAPAETPAPVSAPVGAELGSGVFQSETGVALNLRALWTANVLDAQHVQVRVQVYLDSYSLQIIEARNSLHVSVGDSFKSTDTPAVDHEQNVKLETLLGTTEHIVELADGESGSFPVQVEYAFGGTYMKKELPVIECGGSIQLTR